MRSIIKKIWKWNKFWFTQPKHEAIFSSQLKIERKKSDKVNRKLKVIYNIDVPRDVKPRVIYIVGENNFYWMIGLLCPCGCGNFIHLNLLEETDPLWKYKISKGLISVFPSIWRTSGCKSHFFIRKGKITWVED